MRVPSAIVFLLVLSGLTGCLLDGVDPVNTLKSVRMAAPPTYRGIYVDNFDRILGNRTREDSLLNWCVSSGINSISLYDLNTIMGNERYTDLAVFIQRARSNFGIEQVAAVRGSSANFTQNASYDASRVHTNERFTTYNLENEWWNNGPSCDFSCYTAILKSMSNKARNASPRITTEAYIGWFLNPSGQDLQQAKRWSTGWIESWCTTTEPHPSLATCRAGCLSWVKLPKARTASWMLSCFSVRSRNLCRTISVFGQIFIYGCLCRYRESVQCGQLCG